MRALDPRLLDRARSARSLLGADVAIGLATALLVLLQATLLARVGARAFHGAGLAELAVDLSLLVAVFAGRGALTWAFEVAGRRGAATCREPTMPIHALEGVTPDLPPEGRYWVAPTATVIGKVTLGEGVGVWFGVVIRGDQERVFSRHVDFVPAPRSQPNDRLRSGFDPIEHPALMPTARLDAVADLHVARGEWLLEPSQSVTVVVRMREQQGRHDELLKGDHRCRAPQHRSGVLQVRNRHQHVTCQAAAVTRAEINGRREVERRRRQLAE